MIAAIMIGRKDSKGFPGKNTTMIFGRPLFAYPYMAAEQVNDITSIIVATDDEKIDDYVRTFLGGRTMTRPAHLNTDEAQAGDVYQYIYKELKYHDTTTVEFEMLVLLMANAPMVTADLIRAGIATLRADPTLDSAITVSEYGMWNPSRARRIEDGCLLPMVVMDYATCDRHSVGETWFADFGAVVVRPRCLEKLDGLPPQTWMGKKIAPIKNWGGFDVDEIWQIPQVEYWLRAHGFH